MHVYVHIYETVKMAGPGAISCWTTDVLHTDAETLSFTRPYTQAALEIVHKLVINATKRLSFVRW